MPVARGSAASPGMQNASTGHKVDGRETRDESALKGLKETYPLWRRRKELVGG